MGLSLCEWITTPRVSNAANDLSFPISGRPLTQAAEKRIGRRKGNGGVYTKECLSAKPAQSGKTGEDEGFGTRKRKRRNWQVRRDELPVRLVRRRCVSIFELLAEFDQFLFKGEKPVADRVRKIDVVHGGIGKPLSLRFNHAGRHAYDRRIG